MTYALKGPAFQAAVVSKSTAQHQKALRLTHAAVRAHLTPAQTAKETRTAVRKLATSFSAAALLLVRLAAPWREYCALILPTTIGLARR